MIYDRNHSSIQVGDVYLFRGLSGEPVEEDKLLKIHGISVSGQLQVGIAGADGQVKHITSLSYSDALVMIHEKIWLAEDAPQVYRQPVDEES